MILGWALAACEPKAAPFAHDSVMTADSATDTGDLGSPAWASVAGAPADALGNALTAAGDTNGDGQPDLLVAAYLGNRACVVFGPLTAGNTTIDALSPACLVGETELDYAGYGILAADLNSDGVADVLVGSIGNTDLGSNAGKVYLVAGPLSPGSASLRDAAASTWTGETAGDYAGINLASGGDLNADGVADLLVGASGYDGGGGGGGRAYLLTGPFEPGNTSLSAAFGTVTGLGVPDEAPPPHGAFGTGDFVGDALVGGYDWDGDGFDDLTVGATGDATAGANAGKVAVWFGPLAAGDHPILDADLTILGVEAQSFTGSPLSASPDLDEDGRDELLIAADTLGPGVVYLLTPTPGSTSVSEAPIRFYGAGDGDLFGYSISVVEDADGDGGADVLIGAPGADQHGDETGSAWLFRGPFGSGVIGASTATPLWGRADGDSFGGAVELVAGLDGGSGAVQVVGARNRDANGGFSGQFDLFLP